MTAGMIIAHRRPMLSRLPHTKLKINVIPLEKANGHPTCDDVRCN